MRTWIPVALALALAAPAAYAQPLNENPPTTTIICLDVGGRTLPVECHVPASRLDPREDICLCPDGMRTEVSICPKGVDAPPEGLALMRARRAAVQRGSLVGASFEGRPLCVDPRIPLAGR